MNESKNEGTKERSGGADEPRKMKKITVKIGYDGEMRPVKFMGRKLTDESNHSYQGPNQNRWHEWHLYEVRTGYRVLDAYFTQWQNESGHNSLSDVLTPEEVVKEFPALGGTAINEGIWSDRDVAEDLDKEG